MSKLTKKELAALAMHEIMQREQTKYRERVEEQNRIGRMSDEALKALVDGSAPPIDKDVK